MGMHYLNITASKLHSEVLYFTIFYPKMLEKTS